MQNRKSLEKEYDELMALKGLTETYEDVAISKMQEIRHAVLSTRQFLSGVEDIYSLAKAAYFKEVLSITNRKEREKEIKFIHKNKKTVAVLISGNHSLLGSIIFQTYKVFLEFCRKVECDKVVVGDIGRYLASGERPPLKFSYFPFEDFSVVDSQLKPIVDLITQYEKVFVIYPRFESVLLQLPQIDDISGGVIIEQSLEGKKRYSFEPSPKEVMTYFEGQIIGNVFRQKILETMLAKYSSRLTIMDQASLTISTYIEKNKKRALIETKRMANRKLLNSFSGITLWEDKG